MLIIYDNYESLILFREQSKKYKGVFLNIKNKNKFFGVSKKKNKNVKSIKIHYKDVVNVLYGFKAELGIKNIIKVIPISSHGITKEVNFASKKEYDIIISFDYKMYLEDCPEHIAIDTLVCILFYEKEDNKGNVVKDSNLVFIINYRSINSNELNIKVVLPKRNKLIDDIFNNISCDNNCKVAHIVKQYFMNYKRNTLQALSKLSNNTIIKLDKSIDINFIEDYYENYSLTKQFIPNLASYLYNIRRRSIICDCDKVYTEITAPNLTYTSDCFLIKSYGQEYSYYDYENLEIYVFDGLTSKIINKNNLITSKMKLSDYLIENKKFETKAFENKPEYIYLLKNYHLLSPPNIEHNRNVKIQKVIHKKHKYIDDHNWYYFALGEAQEEYYKNKNLKIQVRMYMLFCVKEVKAKLILLKNNKIFDIKSVMLNWLLKNEITKHENKDYYLLTSPQSEIYCITHNSFLHIPISAMPLIFTKEELLDLMYNDENSFYDQLNIYESLTYIRENRNVHYYRSYTDNFNETSVAFITNININVMKGIINILEFDSYFIINIDTKIILSEADDQIRTEGRIKNKLTDYVIHTKSFKEMPNYNYISITNKTISANGLYMLYYFPKSDTIEQFLEYYDINSISILIEKEMFQILNKNNINNYFIRGNVIKVLTKNKDNALAIKDCMLFKKEELNKQMRQYKNKFKYQDTRNRLS
ncbi:MAG: hypothetical protein QW255_05150 [Candidatus Bilamarchaeaceae archaeon]